MPLILPGESIQAAVNANPSSTAFCLGSGFHGFGSGQPNPTSVIPKSGNIFTGQYGAILDGSAWSTPNLDAAFFLGLNNGIVDVAVQNLTMRYGPSYGVNAYLTAAAWVVDHCEIHHCRNGVSIGIDGVISNSKIHHNEGIRDSPTIELRGGGIALNSARGAQIINNEVSYNGSEQKLIYGTLGEPNHNLYIARNWYHHNYLDGIWIDGDGAGSIIEENLCEDNGRTGITIEIAKSVIVRNNPCRRNGAEGILVSASRDCTVTSNTLEENLYGLGLFLDFARLAESYAFWTVDLSGNTLSGNTVRVPVGGFASLFTYTGAGTSTPYVTNTKGNYYVGNFYYSYTPTGAIFVWGGVNKTFTQWQAIPQDAGGSMSAR